MTMRNNLTPIAKAVAVAMMPASQLPHVITSPPQLAEFQARFRGSWWIGAMYYILATPFGETAVHADFSTAKPMP